MSKPRKKKTPPGARINAATATPEDITDSLLISGDYNKTLKELTRWRRELEAAGKDPFEALARIVAHNQAIIRGHNRGRDKGVLTRQANAAKRAEEIRQQRRDAVSVKEVALDRQASGLRGASERTIRRAVTPKPKPKP